METNVCHDILVMYFEVYDALFLVEIGSRIISIFRTDRKFMGSLRYFTSSYLAGMSLHKEHKFEKVGVEKWRYEKLKAAIARDWVF